MLRKKKCKTRNVEVEVCCGRKYIVIAWEKNCCEEERL